MQKIKQFAVVNTKIIKPKVFQNEDGRAIGMVWTGMHHGDGTYNLSLLIAICRLQNTSTITDFNQNSRLCVTLQRQHYYVRDTMKNTEDTAHGA